MLRGNNRCALFNGLKIALEKSEQDIVFLTYPRMEQSRKKEKRKIKEKCKKIKRMREDLSSFISLYNYTLLPYIHADYNCTSILCLEKLIDA